MLLHPLLSLPSVVVIRVAGFGERANLSEISPWIITRECQREEPRTA